MLAARVFFCWLMFAFPVLAWDSLNEFAFSSEGDLCPRGLPGFNSTPARISEPGFGSSFFYMPSTDQLDVGIAGEWGVSRMRNAFVSSFGSMDSLYRRVYTEWDLSFDLNWILLGGGYGVSAEWIPEEESWTRHRYKGGLTVLFRGIALSAMGWNYSSEPLQELRYNLGFSIKSGNSFNAFSQWDGSSVLLGSTLSFKYFSLSTAYRFPGFSVMVLMCLNLGSWTVGGNLGKNNHSLDWFGGSLERKIEKKTIL